MEKQGFQGIRVAALWACALTAGCSTAESPAPSQAVHGATSGTTGAAAVAVAGSSSNVAGRPGAAAGAPARNPAPSGSGGSAGASGSAGPSVVSGQSGAGVAGRAGSESSAGSSASAGVGGVGGQGAAGRAQPDVPPSAACDGRDPIEILRGYAPADEELAKDYEKYLRDELGSVTCATSGSGTARTVSQPIFVPPNAVYDGKGEKLTADVAQLRCDTSEGEQAEAQRPFFVLAPGAQLENVTITYPGCEGVHMLGDNVLNNITWEDVGEDAASVRSYFPGGKITIKNSRGHKASDKMFQFNAPCDVRIEQFTGSEMGKLVRQNGGSEFELHIDLNTVDVTGVVSAVVQSDSPLCFVRYHALEYAFTGSGDKSDRVFRDIPAQNITEY